MIIDGQGSCDTKQEIQYNFKYSIIQNMIKNIDICKQKKQTDKFWEN